jgi:translation initiation factor IF-1
MSKEDAIEVQGMVTDALSNDVFSIQLDNGQEVRGYLSGKIRKNRIRILLGDKVTVAFSPYDLKQGRIIRRLN